MPIRAGARAASLLLPVLALAAVAASARRADAHGRVPAMMALSQRPGTPEAIVAGTTFGAVITSDGGATWRWICEEAIGYEGMRFESRVSWTSDGALLAVGAGSGLRVSQDLGCTWDDAGGVEGMGVSDLLIVEPPAAPAPRLWATTSRYEAENAVLVSSDGGLTFTRTSLVREKLFFSSIRALPADPRRLRAAAWWFEPPQAWLFASDDGGETWRERRLAATDEPLYVLAASAADPDRLWLRTNGPDSNRVLRADAEGNAATVVLEVPAEIRGLVESPDGRRVWVATDRAVYLSEDSGQRFEPLPRPTAHACIAPRGDQVMACGSVFQDGFSAATTDDGGRTWRPLLDFRRIQGAIRCPSRSAGAICESFFPALAVQIGAAAPPPSTTNPPPTTGPPPQKSSGSCAVAAGGDGGRVWCCLFFGLAVSLALRRGTIRRRR